MPAFVKRSVGSSAGTSEEDATRVWPFSSKKDRNVSRTLREVQPSGFVIGGIAFPVQRLEDGGGGEPAPREVVEQFLRPRLPRQSGRERALFFRGPPGAPLLRGSRTRSAASRPPRTLPPVDARAPVRGARRARWGVVQQSVVSRPDSVRNLRSSSSRAGRAGGLRASPGIPAGSRSRRARLRPAG